MCYLRLTSRLGLSSWPARYPHRREMLHTTCPSLFVTLLSRCHLSKPVPGRTTTNINTCNYCKHSTHVHTYSYTCCMLVHAGPSRDTPDQMPFKRRFYTPSATSLRAPAAALFFAISIQVRSSLLQQIPYPRAACPSAVEYYASLQACERAWNLTL